MSGELSSELERKIMIYIFYYLICIIGIFLVGYPVFVFSGQEQRKTLVYPFSFLVGAAEIIFVSFWFSCFGMAAKYIINVMTLIAVVQWVLLFVKKKNVKFWTKTDKMDYFILGACLLSGLFPIIPMIFFKACFPYCDGFTYVSIADWLVENGFGNQVTLDVYHPWLSQIYLYQFYHLRMGAQYFLAFWTAFFQVKYSIFTYASISGVGVFLLGNSVALFTSHSSSLDKKHVIFATVFSAFNVPIIIWSAIYGFFPQLFGMVFIAASLGWIKKSFEIEEKGFKTDYIVAAFFVTALALCYSEMVPFFVLAVCAWLIYYSVRNRKFKTYCLRLIVIALIACIFMGKYTIEMVQAILSQFGAVVGGDRSEGWFTYLGYILSSVIVDFNFTTGVYGSVYRIIFAAFTLMMLTFLIVGCVRSRRTDKKEALIDMTVLTIPYFLMLVYFTSITDNPFGDGAGNSWGTYKLVQYYAIIPFMCIFSFYADTFRGTKRIFKALNYILLCGFICWACLNTFVYSKSITGSMRTYTGYSEAPLTEYVEIAEKYEGVDSVVNIESTPVKHRQLLTYFLRDNNLASDWSSDDYFNIMREIGDPPHASEGIILTYNPDDDNSLAGMIEVSGSTARTSIEAGTGVGEVESDEINSWTWNERKSEYVIENFSDQEIELDCELVADGGDATVDIYVNDELYDTINMTAGVPAECKIGLGSDEAVRVRFEYNGASVEPSENDFRVLWLRVMNMKITLLRD